MILTSIFEMGFPLVRVSMKGDFSQFLVAAAALVSHTRYIPAALLLVCLKTH